jgi:hypothetical protein
MEKGGNNEGVKCAEKGILISSSPHKVHLPSLTSSHKPSLFYIFPLQIPVVSTCLKTLAKERERERERDVTDLMMVIKFACSIGERVPNNLYWGILEEGKASLTKREEKS